jgi:hypothetical protein
MIVPETENVDKAICSPIFSNIQNSNFKVSKKSELFFHIFT